MARTAAVALIALTLSLVLNPLESRAQSPDNSSKGSAIQAKSKRTQRVASDRYSMNVSWQSWTEKVEMTRISDQMKFPMQSNLRSAGVGFQWAPSRTALGLVLDIRSFFGLAATEDETTLIEYFKSNASFFGAEGNLGWRMRVGKTRMRWALYLGGMYRKFSFTIPAGYSFDPYEGLFIGHAKFELAVPISKRVFLMQQFSIPVFPTKGMGNTWLIGLRI